MDRGTDWRTQRLRGRGSLAPDMGGARSRGAPGTNTFGSAADRKVEPRVDQKESFQLLILPVSNLATSRTRSFQVPAATSLEALTV
ncbi:hypothetical protein GCM10020367_45450 [Streptomyces sannanensis]|uniref:Uncharacterized protein n=1 Tax=Streptomyces sannanensis TaxID=285536 RepID=A0ABP6SGM6_9ACTN